MTSQPTKTTAQERDSELQFEAIAQSVVARLSQNKRVRRNLPGQGRLRMDRQLPFLCVYRSPSPNDFGTQELVTTEAAYLFASGNARHHAGVVSLCQQIDDAMQEHFGTFLLIEVWAMDEDPAMPSACDDSPAFEIVSVNLDEIPSTIETFQTALAEISVGSRRASVTTRGVKQVCPPRLRPLESLCGQDDGGGCCVLGLAVKPIYRNTQSGALYPLVLESLRWQLATALRKTIAQFTGVLEDESTKDPAEQPSHIAYQALGPSALVKAARLVDQQLCEISESFDFLLQVTPTNGEHAWLAFAESGYVEMPTLTYRPLPYHPSLLKRRLYDIEIERIEDPTLAHLFWEKQAELDRQLTALRDLNTPQFLHSSFQLYGGVEDSLAKLAYDILERTARCAGNSDTEDTVPLKQFIDCAHEEIDYYHTRMNEFNAKVEVSEKIAAGIMVSQERLLVAKSLRIVPARIAPLLHHEVGTHLLTYFNGRCQPFRQLYAGLAGYEELQEGLAVLAEYLVGGLTHSRARTLAARVIAAEGLIRKCSFAETFASLHNDFGFSAQRAFATTLRVYRGGGFTKDIIYLRGLRDLLEYLAAGHDIEPLYVGKIGLQHVPFVQEMRRRKIIETPRILPRFLDDNQVQARLEAARGMSVLDLLETDR